MLWGKARTVHRKMCTNSTIFHPCVCACVKTDYSDLWLAQANHVTTSRDTETDLCMCQLSGPANKLRFMGSDSPWVKHKHTHTWRHHYDTMCVCKLTRTERGDIVRAGEVQRGPRDVHHVVIIVVTGEMKAIEAPVAVPRVLPHSEPCGEQRSTGDVNSSSTSLWATESGRGERQLYLCWSKNQTFRAGKCGCLERVSSHFTL